MSWFLLELVLPTKTCISVAGLGPHFGGIWLEGDGTSIGRRVDCSEHYSMDHSTIYTTAYKE